MGYRDAVARGLYWKPFARMIDACIRPASSLADFWSSGSIAAKAGWIPTGNRVESRARDLRSCSCLCKASPSRPGRLLSCLLVDIPQPSTFDRGPHLKRRFKKLAVVLLLAWRDGALTVSPVAKLRAQRRAAPRALNLQLLARGVTHQLLMIPSSPENRIRARSFFRSFSLFLFVWFFLFPFSVGTYQYRTTRITALRLLPR